MLDIVAVAANVANVLISKGLLLLFKKRLKVFFIHHLPFQIGWDIITLPVWHHNNDNNDNDNG